ncbi:unnamed protein product, partial [Nesidiocoris tenuis]
VGGGGVFFAALGTGVAAAFITVDVVDFRIFGRRGAKRSDFADAGRGYWGRLAAVFPILRPPVGDEEGVVRVNGARRLRRRVALRVRIVVLGVGRIFGIGRRERGGLRGGGRVADVIAARAAAVVDGRRGGRVDVLVGGRRVMGRYAGGRQRRQRA